MRPIGRYPSKTKTICGTISTSIHEPVTCRGTPLTRPAPLCFKKPARPANAPGCSRTSASTNTSVSKPSLARSASTAQACCLPFHPGGSSAAVSSRTRGSSAAIRRTMSAVPSVEPSSSTTTSSAASPCPASNAAETAAAMPAASSRAGISTLTRASASTPAGPR